MIGRPTLARRLQECTGVQSLSQCRRLRRLTSTPAYARLGLRTGQTAQIKSTPILVNGILYLTTPDNVWRSMPGRHIHYGTTPIRRTRGLHIGHRGVAMYKDSVYSRRPMRTLSPLTPETAKFVGTS